MNRSMAIWLIGVLFVTGLLLTGCGQSDDTSSSLPEAEVAVATQPATTPTSSPPTDTPAPPTNTPVPPTDTPAPPTHTATPTVAAPTDTPVPPTSIPEPVRVTLLKNGNLRGGPGVNYLVARAGKAGESFTITGKFEASDGVWWQFDLGDGASAWVRSDLAVVSGPVDLVVAVADLPPTPAATPTPKPAAGPTGIILYSNANMDEGQWELWEYNFATGGQRMIHAWRTEVDFSRDGRQVAYFAWPEANGMADVGIWIMSNDYSNPRKILPGGAYPSFGPTGDRLAVMGDDLIYIVNADGSDLRELIQGEYPDWSPTDNRILFRNCFGGDCGVWITDADAGGRTRLTSGGSDGQPAWSPDGRRVAFISQEEGNFEIYVINSDGAGRTRLTNRAASDGLPAWSPDGNWIAWRSDEGGTWGVWVMRPDGSNQRRLFDAPVLPVWFYEKMAWRR